MTTLIRKVHSGYENYEITYLKGMVEITIADDWHDVEYSVSFSTSEFREVAARVEAAIKEETK